MVTQLPSAQLLQKHESPVAENFTPVVIKVRYMDYIMSVAVFFCTQKRPILQGFYVFQKFSFFAFSNFKLWLYALFKAGIEEEEDRMFDIENLTLRSLLSSSYAKIKWQRAVGWKRARLSGWQKLEGQKLGSW